MSENVVKQSRLKSRHLEQAASREAQPSSDPRKFLQRAERISSDLGQSRPTARFATNANGASFVRASYLDISLTGMRLISRFPIEQKKGDSIQLQFALPNEEQETTKFARVVRKENEYEFAVQFIKTDLEHQRSFESLFFKYRAFTRRSRAVRLLVGIRDLIHSYRRGLVVGVCASAVGFAGLAWIKAQSDETRVVFKNPHPKPLVWENLKSIF